MLLLLGAGVIGGAVNAIAGGGTFFTFPAMIAAGLDPLTANASNAVAIYPGHATAVPAYRTELRAAGRVVLRRAAIAAVGGAVGAALLIVSGEAVFGALVPWLLLLATLIFWSAPRLHSLTAGTRVESPFARGVIQFVFAIYGGYFGAGLGVLLMAALTLIGLRDVQMANAQKNLLATVITTLSVGIFVTAGVVAWAETLLVLVGASAGGYAGARLARRIPAKALRICVIGVGLGLSVYYFLT